MPTPSEDMWHSHRVILCHFDSYSTAMVFARWPNGSLLAPEPLPTSAQLIDTPEDIATMAGQTLIDAAAETLGIGAQELHYAADYQACANSDTGPIRIHLLRFTHLDAPAARIEAQGGMFRPISALRGAAPIELALVRKVFDLIMSGGAK